MLALLLLIATRSFEQRRTVTLPWYHASSLVAILLFKLLLYSMFMMFFIVYFVSYIVLIDMFRITCLLYIVHD